MTGEDFTNDEEKDIDPQKEKYNYDSPDILKAIQKTGQYPQNILENFILKYDEAEDKKAQQKLANENNKQREIIEFRRIMGQFYTWSARIVDATIKITNEHIFPDHIKTEIIKVIQERQDADEEEDDGAFVIPQKLNEYTHRAKQKNCKSKK